MFLTTLIRELAGEGRTVVFTSHLLAQAEEICDRIAILGQGRLLVQGTPAELLGGLEPRAPGLSRLERIYLEKINVRP
jgi:ABC-2 type transport system ATP-binding protein